MMLRLLQDAAWFVAILLTLALATLAGCTTIPMQVEITYPDGTTIKGKGRYTQILQNKSLGLSKGRLDYNVSNDPIEKAFELGRKAGAP